MLRKILRQEILNAILSQTLIIVANDGRCRHAITVTGIAEDPRRVYLLEAWAKSCGTDEFIETMLHLAIEVWKSR